MLREQAKLFNRLSIFCDGCCIILSYYVAYMIRDSFPRRLMPWQEYSWVLVFSIPIWCMFMYRNNLYGSIRRLSFFDITTRVLNSVIPGSLLIAALIFFFDRLQYSRLFYVIFVLISASFLIIEKAAVRSFLGYLRSKGRNTRNLIIVGTHDKAIQFQKLIEDHQDWGLRTLGFVQVDNVDLKNSVAGHAVLGRVDELEDICVSFPVDEVVFCLSKEQYVDADQYFRPLEELGITVRMALDFFAVRNIRKEVSLFHNTVPVLTFYSKAFDAQQLLVKRLMDIVGSMIGLSIFICLFPLIALSIKTNSPGPIFFSQERVRENGRVFKCWKLRSMFIDAEERKKELMAQNELNGAIFKIKNDPRITPIGRFLRKTSIDELPQFWNVLKGEMSLVGTRPPTPEEVANYQNWHRRRISVKPGITGMWQVSGRNKVTDFDEVVKLDLFYIDHWSLWLDIKILLKTFWVVCKEEGSS